jgi:2-polyprenyl-3-methyl-5-hydroxy-6-metoxy-1,4-benzoquinol methylase
MSELTCRICSSHKVADVFVASEMLEGSREQFEYFVCGNCFTVQIGSNDLDMTKYYNKNYYSLSTSSSNSDKLLVRIRNQHVFKTNISIFGSLLQHLYPIYKEHEIIGSLIKSESRILDIGCGNGEFLKLIHSLDFQYLTGIEPYLANCMQLDTHFQISNANLGSLDATFDIIRLHHVFEHVADPIEILTQVYNLLEDDGLVVLTIPIADYIFSIYRENAYLIQAPHHFHLFTLSGIIGLAEKQGFFIKNILRNPLGISNWIYISELWKRNITQQEANQSAKSIFSKDEMLQFKKQEAELAKLSKGDNVTLILSKQQ